MQSTQALLRQVGITSGQKVLCIGFRDLPELQELASLIGHAGHILGIDIDARHVQAASKMLSNLSISSISVKEGSALAIPAGDYSFDLILCKSGIRKFKRRLFTEFVCGSPSPLGTPGKNTVGFLMWNSLTELWRRDKI